MSDNWDKDHPSEGMKAKVNRKCHVSFFACAAETPSTIKMLFILYFASGPESEPESIRRPESESESEQPHQDSAPLVQRHRNTTRVTFNKKLLNDDIPLLDGCVPVVLCYPLQLGLSTRPTSIFPGPVHSPSPPPPVLDPIARYGLGTPKDL